MATALSFSVVRPAVSTSHCPAPPARPPSHPRSRLHAPPRCPQAPRTAAFAAAQQQRRPARRLQPVRAQADDDQKGLDFTSNKRAVRSPT